MYSKKAALIMLLLYGINRLSFYLWLLISSIGQVVCGSISSNFVTLKSKCCLGNK